MTDLLAYDFMQRALIAALMVGLVAPLVGVFLVQRKLSLIGDGMGHVALAGVAVGLVLNTSPVWAALVAAVAAAVVIELIRASGRTQGDVALESVRVESGVGQVTMSGTTLTYTSPTDFAGDVTVRYEVSDELDDEADPRRARATVTIRVSGRPSPPEAVLAVSEASVMQMVGR